jgi:hypothetical protein
MTGTGGNPEPGGGGNVRIHRAGGTGFVQIPNITMRDPDLSFAARGVLACLLSRPDTWRTSVDLLAAEARRDRKKRGEGRYAMTAIFKELQDLGYLRRIRTRGPGGRFATEVHIWDTSQRLDPHLAVPEQPGPGDVYAGGTGTWSTEPRSTGAPDTGSPVTGGPPTERPPASGPSTESLVTGRSSGRQNTKTEKEDRTNNTSLSRALATIRRDVPDATEREISEIADHYAKDPAVKGPVGPYLAAAIEKGDAADLVTKARERLAAGSPLGTAAPRPPWCGECDERTRMLGVETDSPRRCPECNPQVLARAAAAAGH